MIKIWLRAHPLLGFFALTFGISWGGITLVLAARSFDLSSLQPLEIGLIFAAMLLGPSISSLALIALFEGRAGLRRLAAKALRWRLDVRWYAIALLTAPVILLTILWPLGALRDPAFAPRFQWALFAVGLIAGSFEEIGWTGFATPRLLASNSVGGTGICLGALWALWYVSVDFRYNFAAMGFFWPLEFAIVYLATLTPYPMLMTWVYSRTQSLLLVILMHASFTGWLLVLLPKTKLYESLAWQAIFALLLWCAVSVALYSEAARTGKSAWALRCRIRQRSSKAHL